MKASEYLLKPRLLGSDSVMHLHYVLQSAGPEGDVVHRDHRLVDIFALSERMYTDRRKSNTPFYFSYITQCPVFTAKYASHLQS